MPDNLVTLLAFAFYVTVGMVTARWRYRALRPYTEPLACQKWLQCGEGNHADICFRRPGTLIDSNRDAAGTALMQAIVWPATVLLVCATVLVVVGDKPLPEEVRAKNRRLERELDIGDE